MTLVDRVGGDLPRGRVTVELDDIQATVLRYRPEPYYGTHVHAARRRCASRPRVPAPADAACRLRRRLVEGRRALDRGRDHLCRARGARACREDSLQSFPEAFRVGMAARADQLRDDGVNDPKNWEPPFGTGSGPHRRQRLQRLRGEVAPHPGRWRGEQYEGLPGRHAC